MASEKGLRTPGQAGVSRVTVRWPDTPRRPLPPESWLCGALRAGEAGIVATGSVQPSLRGAGRYNNQWMVVDYKAFVPGGASPGSKVLTILEQIP